MRNEILRKIAEWIETFPGFDILGSYKIDWTDDVPANGSFMPQGMVELARTRDILGNVTVTDQYNFGLYICMEKPPADEVASAYNADWVMDFQAWAQEQSCSGLAPIFGDEPESEAITAQNGTLYSATDMGVAVYMIQLSFRFIKYF